MFSSSSAVARSAICTAIASINEVHVIFWGEHNNIDITPFQKLVRKTLSFLSGELKSESNLQRFYVEFQDWRETLEEDDSLAWRITELCFASLSSAVDCLFDPECDDLSLIENTLFGLYEEMDELGADSEPLKEYWSALKNEWQEQLNGKTQRPLPQLFFRTLNESDASLFGLEC